MTSDIDLMRLHVEALFTHDELGHLVAVNEPDGAAAPRFFLGRTAGEKLLWFRNDVEPALVHDLRAICESLNMDLDDEAGLDSAPLIACLARYAPISKTWAGPAFGFPVDLPGDATAVRVTTENAMLLSPYLENWRDDVATGAPMAAALEDGHAVSICCSVRVTLRAHEAGVETHPDFRGRGYGARAVNAWARLVRDMDGIPLYSTSWQNHASRVLAKKLGLIQFGVDLHIT